jgi:hypothetical protein
MTRHDLVLSALASAGIVDFEPVQVQKLFFLIDENVPSQIGGRAFNFKPRAYGPFDGAVYDALRDLAARGQVEISELGGRRYSTYRLSPSGFARGQQILRDLPAEIQLYFAALTAWIKSLSFDQLVSAIYGDYPEMKVNSIFRG